MNLIRFVSNSFLKMAARIRIINDLFRIRIRQKVSHPTPDPDPQHCFQARQITSGLHYILNAFCLVLSCSDVAWINIFLVCAQRPACTWSTESSAATCTAPLSRVWRTWPLPATSPFSTLTSRFPSKENRPTPVPELEVKATASSSELDFHSSGGDLFFICLFQ